MLKTDVAIIGGGPAGSTVGTFLKKYNPSLDVTIIEREKFPRDHVGESHLPAISAILDEMGVWDKVEAANFPIKIGATFKWGAQKEFWDTDFLHHQEFKNVPRPQKFEDQRTRTAFQVDRSIYDKVLLDHAASLGCRVLEETKVTKVDREGDKIIGLNVMSEVADTQAQLGDDGRIEARYYVDCSGEGGFLRRAMDIEIESPTALRNIAIYRYYQDAKWAVTLGNGGTRIQIMSLGWGWMWFIPITPTRTSVGLVLPSDYYKKSGKSVAEIYADAVKEEPLISSLLETATAEPEITATKDWNFISKRLVGENWFLAGDSCGFADPILSAGMTLAHTSARKVAFTLLELFRGKRDPMWLKKEYEDGHRGQIRHHMQFADFWYSSNGQFTDLKDYCQEIAKEAGLNLDPATAFQWLATGGFTIDEPGVAAALTYRVSGLKLLAVQLGGSAPDWEIQKTNFWRLDIKEAVEAKFVRYIDGEVRPIPCLKKGAKILPLIDVFKFVVNAFKDNADSIMILESAVNQMIREDNIPTQEAVLLTIEALESMLLEGWIKAKVVPSRPFIKVN